MGEKADLAPEIYEHLWDLFENTHDLVQSVRPDGTLLYVNRAWREAMGYAADEIANLSIANVVHERAKEEFADLLRRLLAGESVQRAESVFVTKGGSELIVEGTNRCRFADGRAVSVWGIFRDITQRKKAKEALCASEAFLRMSQQAGQCGSWEWEPDTGRLRWSEETCRIHGIAPEQFRGTMEHGISFIHAEDLPRIQKEMRTFMETGHHRSTEFRIMRPSGEIGVAWVRAELIKDKAGQVRAIGIITDVTSRRRAEDESRRLETQLLQAQKLESLGVLAGGLAHDFNNLLTTILGYATLAAEALPADAAARPMLAEIARAGERAAELTGQMLAYSGRCRCIAEPLRLNDVVRDMATLLRTVVSKKAELTLDLAGAPMEGDSAQIRQVILNLVSNASDALDGQPGRIAVRTGVRAQESSTLASFYFGQKLAAGEYTFLEVSDTGQGMDAETLGKICDPFYTTKTAGRGLGLAAVLGIARGHGGGLQVTSAPKQGTRAVVLLPTRTRIAKDVALVTGERRSSGTGTVLVVDDEDGVRAFMEKVLVNAGFQLLTASDGLDALNTFIGRRQTISAVVLDLTMPRLDGWEVAARIRELGSEVPILLVSGYSQPDLPPNADRLRIAAFLRKPFKPAELVARVSQLVAAR